MSVEIVAHPAELRKLGAIGADLDELLGRVTGELGAALAALARTSGGVMGPIGDPVGELAAHRARCRDLAERFVVAADKLEAAASSVGPARQPILAVSRSRRTPAPGALAPLLQRDEQRRAARAVGMAAMPGGRARTAVVTSRTVERYHAGAGASFFGAESDVTVIRETLSDGRARITITNGQLVEATLAAGVDCRLDGGDGPILAATNAVALAGGIGVRGGRTYEFGSAVEADTWWAANSLSKRAAAFGKLNHATRHVPDWAIRTVLGGDGRPADADAFEVHTRGGLAASVAEVLAGIGVRAELAGSATHSGTVRHHADGSRSATVVTRLDGAALAALGSELPVDQSGGLEAAVDVVKGPDGTLSRISVRTVRDGPAGQVPGFGPTTVSAGGTSAEEATHTYVTETTLDLSDPVVRAYLDSQPQPDVAAGRLLLSAVAGGVVARWGLGGAPTAGAEVTVTELGPPRRSGLGFTCGAGAGASVSGGLGVNRTDHHAVAAHRRLPGSDRFAPIPLDRLGAHRAGR